MLDLDLTLLRDPKRFQEMCFRLARYEFAGVVPLSDSWDGGRDIVFCDPDRGEVAFQCKFVKDLIAAKAKITASLDALLKSRHCTAYWILCVPVNPSAIFLDWLRSELDKRHLRGILWGREELLARLEEHHDVIETFFYPIFAELEVYFRSERLELFRLILDPACQWEQPDQRMLYFMTRDFVTSADLVFDVTVRNRGTLATAITRIEAEIFDRHHKMHGLPGEGLLFPQITYTLSISGGKVGSYLAECEPPLIVKAGSLERFKLRITDTGFAWGGGLRISLLAGETERLYLPALRIFA